MMVFIGIFAWLLLTCLPVATAICWWKLAHHFRQGWVFHLAFLPGFLILTWLLDQLLFWAAGDDGEGPPGLGFALIPALFLMVVTVPTYFGALLIQTVRKFKRAQ